MTESTRTDVVYLSPRDEAANAWTHAAGCVLSLIAIVVLLNHPDDPSLGFKLASTTYAVCMVAVYFCSTMSHVVHEPVRRHNWRAWDQGVIYALIAGTYTPFIYGCSPAGWRVPLLVAVWLAALLGFVSKVFGNHRVNGISTLTYILLGWLPAIPLVARTPSENLMWMIAGGVAYTLGTGFLARDQRYTYFHAIWHLMVILGSACHFVAVYRLPDNLPAGI